MADPFVHLHVASGYSLQYGASHPHVLVERAAWLDTWLDSAPQTNEVGRSAVLVVPLTAAA